MARDLIFFPCNGNAREALGAALASPEVWRPIGFIDDDPALAGAERLGLPVLGGRAELERRADAAVIACPGRPETFRQRPDIIASLGLDPSRFARLAHPTAVIGPGCAVGRNVILAPTVVLTAAVSIADHVVVLAGTVLSHECVVGPYVMIGAGAVLAGGVQVGAGCYIGAGARVRQGVSIGPGALVGMGATVLTDVPAGSVVAGVPARPIRSALAASKEA